MKRLSLVAIGGVIGSLARYSISEIFPNHPFAIFLANILGVAIAGLVAYRMVTTEDMRAFLIAGVAGGLTTYSSVALIHAQNNSISAVAYFYGMVSASLLTLYLCRPKAQR